MKALTSPNNKHGSKNPHTNTLETKTIRSKSWPYALLEKRHTPAIALVVAGFFMALVPTTQAAISSWQDDNDKTNYNETDSDTIDGTTQISYPSTTPASDITESKPSSSEQSSPSSEASKGTGSQSNSIKISTEVSSTQNGSSVKNTDVVVNGEKLEPDANGRIKKDYKDENSNIKIRAKIDPEQTSGSSASIIISSSLSEDKR